MIVKNKKKKDTTKKSIVFLISSSCFKMYKILITVFKNPRKSLIQHCERSELHLHFVLNKTSLKMPKSSHLASFSKPHFEVKQSIQEVNCKRTKIGGKCQNLIDQIQQY